MIGLPMYRGGELKEGLQYNLHAVCTENFGARCVSHYESMQPGAFKVCPFGLCSFRESDDSVETIYTSMNVTEVNGRSFSHKYSQNSGSYFAEKANVAARMLGVMRKQLTMIGVIDAIQKYEFDEWKINGIFDTLHELRALNSLLKGFTNQLFSMARNTDGDLDYDYEADVKYRVHATAEFITVRLNLIDIILNPKLLLGRKLERKIGIYRKLSKASRILSPNKKNRNIVVNFENQDWTTISCTDDFELVFFIILENAVKYANEASPINIFFMNKESFIEVEISNQITKGLNVELHRLTTRGYRGANSDRGEGSGLGLYVAAEICKRNGVTIVPQVSRTQKPSFDLFKITISIPKSMIVQS